MPRSLLVNHLVLLLCGSIMLGAGIGVLMLDVQVGGRPTSDGFFLALTIIIGVTGAVMAVTEWFTGIRWVPIVALLAYLASTVTSYRSDAVGWPSVLLWFVTWAAVAYWFYRLAFAARADR